MAASPVGPLASLPLRSFLRGAWSLTRDINDGEGAFTGIARFAEALDGDALVWHETGRLRLGGYAGEAHRTLRIVPAAGAWEVRFDDGRRFHALDLAGGRCEAEHRCGPDSYHGVYAIAGVDRVTVTWRVTGPGRDDAIATDYRRAEPS